MTVEEVMAKLQIEKEQRVPARFHCRAIMVQTIQQYKKLLEALKKIPDIMMISIDDLFSGNDVMPDYGKLIQKEYQNKWIILPGVSEYLRLFHFSEENSQRFSSLWRHQFDASSTGRIIIPLWGCESLWFDNALHLNDDERQKEDYFNCESTTVESQHMDIQVLSSDFKQYIGELFTNHVHVFRGLREWYEFWYDPQFDSNYDFRLLTRRYKGVKTTEGDISIHIIKDTLSFVKENLQTGNLLNSENCPLEAQKCLFAAAQKGLHLDEAILHSLNVYKIKPIDIMSKWTMLSAGQKCLVFLWYNIHPDDSYLSHCVSISRNVDDFLEHLLMDIFSSYNNHPDWVEDARTLIDALPLQRTDDYYAALDEIPSMEERLNYLSARDARERVYILHLVGQWLRDDPESVIQSTRLKDIYPALSAYLSDDYQDEKLNEYFRKYKFYKLSNTLPQDQELYFAGIDVEEYDFRYPVLHGEANEQTAILWIDALGAEWIPLLKWALSSACDGTISSIRVSQAVLPSETHFNEQWNHMQLYYKKYDKLDKLAHKGVIDNNDYYVCVEEQIRFVCDITVLANKLLQEYSRVLITGDHGTSRLAARFFHKYEGLPVPQHASVGSHGRFCKVIKEPDYVSSTQQIVRSDNAAFLVFSNYDHYTQSGFAAGADDNTPIYGEIHGGASPEEMLVPVITINSRNEIPLAGKWTMTNNSTKITNKRVRCEIQFSKPVYSVQAKIGVFEAECLSGVMPSKDWSLVFTGIRLDRPESHDVTVIADGTLIKMDAITIKPALGGGEPF